MIIVKTPGINSSGNAKGCRNAGNAIITALDYIHSNEKGIPIDRKLLDLEEIHVDNDNLEEQGNLIYRNSLELLEKQEKVIFLGGDHSISFYTGKAFLDHCKKEKKEACLIVFDAHADCEIPGENPTNRQWLRALIESGFTPSDILLVGNRNKGQEEISFLSKNKVKQIGMNEISNNLEEITDIIMEFAHGKELYVSLDIGVVHPVYSPGIYNKEPGGLTSRQAIYIVSRMSMMKNLKIFDLVEVNIEKDKDSDGITTKLAAKLLGEVI